MSQKQKSGGLDIFRIIAALLVISIHTSPFSGISENLDFFVTRIVARVAVPFFFMVTGQYILSDFYNQNRKKKPDASKIWNYIKKLFFMYIISIIIYIPIGIYAGHYRGLDLFGALKMLLFDGTFYHLWYFPACIIGVLLVYGMSRWLDIGMMTAIAVVLYIVGLLGDSYYGLTVKVPALNVIYNAMFRVFSYTRNGFFFAPVFLVLGIRSEEYSKKISGAGRLVGLLLSFILMTVEGFALHVNGMQRHDSMYVFLPAVMIFLYQLLSDIEMEPKKQLRRLSTWIYILHPAVIVILRAAAKLVPAAAHVVGNSLLNFFVVSAVSVFAAWLVNVVVNKFCRNSDGRTALESEGYAKDRAWIELDMEALKNNVTFLKNMLPAGCELMPAVKAQAYGHGAVIITKQLETLGIDSFCVACVDEAVELRKAGVKGMLLVLGYTHPREWDLLSKYGITQTIVDFEYAVRLNDYGIRNHRKFHVHVGVDTGMHRLGERSENIDGICSIMDMKNLRVDGIFTHLSADDSLKKKDVEFTLKQVDEFEKLKKELTERGYILPKTHISASYGVLNYPKLGGDYARVGIALYGVLSTAQDEEAWKDKLFPVLRLKARVSSVRELNNGECAGYGMAFTARKDMKIAALSIGYADGLPRELSQGRGYVLIAGKKAPIIGRICMDQTIVDVSDIAGVKSGDIAVIIGRSGDECINASQLAEESGTITNEILSRMGARLKRTIAAKQGA